MINRRSLLQRTALAALSTTGIASCTLSRSQQGNPSTSDRVFAAHFQARRRYIPTAFGEIALLEQGDAGLPAALFLHGFPLNAFQWRGALQRLAPKRRCLAPDFLGMGFTRVARGQDVEPESQVAMLVALLDQLGIATVDLVANDSGGAVAQLFMLAHSERVRSLLLTNCDSETDSPPAALLPVIDLARQGLFVDDWLGVWFADRPLARSPVGIGGMCYANPAHPTDAAIETYFGPLLASQQSKDRAHAYAIALARNALLGTAARLQACKVPTRIVWGMADTIFSPNSPEWLHRTLGASRGVRRLEHSKLFWPEERADVVAEEASALWSAHADSDYALARR